MFRYLMGMRQTHPTIPLSMKSILIGQDVTKHDKALSEEGGWFLGCLACSWSGQQTVACSSVEKLVIQFFFAQAQLKVFFFVRAQASNVFTWGLMLSYHSDCVKLSCKAARLKYVSVRFVSVQQVFNN